MQAGFENLAYDVISTLVLALTGLFATATENATRIISVTCILLL